MPRSRTAPTHCLLLVDAGNTRTKVGVFADADPPAGVLPTAQQEWIVENGDPVDWGDVQSALPENHRLRLCLTGSNPQRVGELLTTLPDDWPRPMVLPQRDAFPLEIEVDFPEKVGIDRLLNAIAANHVRRAGQAAVLISSGTATTIDYVNPRGDFCGGAILPGFELSARSLHQYTALLPLVPLGDVLERPPDDVGRNTEAAVRSGLYWGHVGAVRELLRRLMQRAAVDQQGATDGAARHLGNVSADELPLVLLTGGAAPVLQPHLPSLTRYEPQLALQGLALLCRGAQG
jgi:type III pantothenate kinase